MKNSKKSNTLSALVEYTYLFCYQCLMEIGKGSVDFNKHEVLKRNN